MCWTLNARDFRAARAARHAATEALATLTTSAELLAAAELIIGELLSNAARHADGQVCLEVGTNEGLAEISVHDSSATFTLDIKRPTSDFSESGRGLYIISQLARRVRIHSLSGIGKRISVTLDLTASSNAALRFCGRPWLRDSVGVCFAPRLARYADASTGRLEA